MTTNISEPREKQMRLHVFFSVCIVFIVGLAGIRPAAAAEVLYDGAGFIQGQQSFVQSFNITGPGTLTVTMSNIAWPESLASLNVVLGTSSGLMGAEMGVGSETFNVNSGVVFAQWFGTAQGPLDIGVYSMKIVFQPNGTVVPLPASILLLASGLLYVAVWQRRRDPRFPAPAYS